MTAMQIQTTVTINNEEKKLVTEDVITHVRDEARIPDPSEKMISTNPTTWMLTTPNLLAFIYFPSKLGGTPTR